MLGTMICDRLVPPVPVWAGSKSQDTIMSFACSVRPFAIFGLSFCDHLMFK
jgi:hypothetical protein